VRNSRQLEERHWENIAYGQPPSVGRFLHSSAGIGSRVYFFGGHDGRKGHIQGESVVHAELSPSVSWVPTKLTSKLSNSFARSQFCSCKIGDKVYIFGGWDGSRRGVPMIVFDPEEGTLSEVETSGESPAHICFGAAASVQSRIVVFGGCGKRTEARVWMIDVQGAGGDSLLMWTQGSTQQAPSKRSSHAMAAVGRRVWVFGGKDAEGQTLGDLHCYEVDVASPSGAGSAWIQQSAQGEGPSPRFGHAMTAMSDVVYLFGGMGPSNTSPSATTSSGPGSGPSLRTFNDLWRLDCSGGAPAWQAVTISAGPEKAPSPRMYHSLTAVESMLCVYGGRPDTTSPAFGDLWTMETSLGGGPTDDPENGISETASQ